MPITSKNSKPAISCIYINYNSVHFLERSLETLFRFESHTPYEVIVVNNDEKEERAVEEIKKRFGITTLPYVGNDGFGPAVNRAALKASGPLMFLVNPDTEWRQPIFEDILKIFKEREKLGALGIQLVSAQGEKEKKSAWLSGGAFFIPKNVFTLLGGFDERFFVYFEDRDLCLRLQEAGYQILHDDTHQLTHFHGKSHKSKRSQKKMYDRSLYQFTKKHWPLWKHFIFHLIHPLYRLIFPYGRN